MPTMRTPMWTCLLLAAVLGVHGAPPGAQDSRIVGGVAVDINMYPYQLSLRINGSHICGASIISKDWAVTAAHCIKYPQNITTVKAGSASRTIGGTIHSIVQTVVNPQYNGTITDYDIAVLRVATPFNFAIPGIAAIALPAVNAPVADSSVATASGWGYTVGGGTILPVALQAVNVSIVNQDVCQKVWFPSRVITARMICAGGASIGGIGSCNGDSGGPLVLKVGNVKQLIGIVSWGSPCAKPNIPDVYARVANLRAWIKTVTLV